MLGGHDHFYKVETVPSTVTPGKQVVVVKSGSDFEDFSVIDIDFNKSNNFNLELEVNRRSITKDYKPDEECVAYCESKMISFKKDLET